ncbi:MAG: hypothetical protein AAF443_07435 [Chlamydiota bacterium]
METKLHIVNEKVFLLQKEAQALLKTLNQSKSITDKIAALNQHPRVIEGIESLVAFSSFLATLSPLHHYVAKVLIAIGQEELFAFSAPEYSTCRAHWKALVDKLVAIENFYKPIGGVIGYQCLVLDLLSRRKRHQHAPFVSLHPPTKIDLTKDSLEVRAAIIDGIRAQGQFAEIYPVGGAADRLQLVDEATQERLPAARLVFLGNHLLEGVIRDLQAREYLSFRLFGDQVVTPIAMMTSDVNGNSEHIRAICAENHWFGRPKGSFRFFKQPSVPTFTQEGKWCLKSPGKLLLRPGGHGVIWTLAEREGVLSWLQSLGRKKLLVRQINNPMAGIDSGLLAFLGIGWRRDKLFGFASCHRLVNAHEGMNVVKVVAADNGKKAMLTNIEYCDFAQFGIEDKPETRTSRTSRFPSNTNILFVDLAAAAAAVKRVPFPGLLVNFREMEHFDGENLKKEQVARLEATMQNLADCFATKKGEKEPPTEELCSYLTFNKRRKTISTAKRKTNPSGSLVETPAGCYYDFLKNAHELLEKYCAIQLPPLVDEQTFKRYGPSFLFSYHPALGPLYTIIGQKIRGGQFEAGSELHLEIADIEIAALQLQGSLLITASSIMGHTDDKGHLRYSNRTGQCILRRVSVENCGIDWSDDHLFWQHDVKRSESLQIELQGHSQFIAEDVTFKGSQLITVPDGMRVTASQQGEKVVFAKQPLQNSDPFWHYQVNSNEQIILSQPKV